MAVRTIPDTLGITNFTISPYSPSQEKYLRPYAADHYISEVGTTRFSGTVGLNPRVETASEQGDLDLITFNNSLDRYRNQVRIPLPEKFRPTTPAEPGATLTVDRIAFRRDEESIQFRFATTGITQGSTDPVRIGSFINVGNELYQVIAKTGLRWGHRSYRLRCIPNRPPLGFTTPRGWQTLFNFPSNITLSGFGGMVVFRGSLYIAVTDNSFNTTLYIASPTLNEGWSLREVYSGGFYGSGLAVAQLPGDTRPELYAIQGGGTTTVIRLNVDDPDPANNSQETVGTYRSQTGSGVTFVNGAIGWQAPGDPREYLYFIKGARVFRVTDLVDDGALVDSGASGVAKGVQHVFSIAQGNVSGAAAIGDSMYFLSAGGSRLDIDRFQVISRTETRITGSQTRIYDQDSSWNGTFATSLDILHGVMIVAGVQGTPRTAQIAKINLTPDTANNVEINNPFVNARLYATRQTGYRGPIVNGLSYDWRELSPTVPPVDHYLPSIGLEDI